MAKVTDLPPLRVMPKAIEASCYNRVRLALRRLGKPLRFALREHRGLDAILDDRAWVCVDTNAGDFPVLAWCEFAVRGRDNLHRPVECRLKLFHWKAGLIMGTALEAIDSALAERLGRSGSPMEGSDAAG